MTPELFLLECINFLFNKILNKDFILPLLGTGLGAFFGASGAQTVIENLKNKELALKEIKNVNAAIAILTHINKYLFVTKSFVKPTHKEYFTQRKSFLNWINAGKNIDDFDFVRLCPIIGEPQIDTVNLRSILFNNLSLNEKAIYDFTVIEESIRLLNETIKENNKLTENYLSEHKKFTDQERIIDVANYFGTTIDGNRNLSNHNVVQYLLIRNDDAIYFCMSLLSKLIKHGRSLKTNYDGQSPEIYEPNFRDEINLIPFGSKYDNYKYY